MKSKKKINNLKKKNSYLSDVKQLGIELNITSKKLLITEREIMELIQKYIKNVKNMNGAKKIGRFVKNDNLIIRSKN